ncbi:transglycosylase domain-containing protein [Patescibacteria group bacterium]
MNKFLRNVNKQVILAQDTLILIGNIIIKAVKFIIRLFDKGADLFLDFWKKESTKKVLNNIISIKDKVIGKIKDTKIREKKSTKKDEKKIWTPQYAQIKKDKVKVKRLPHLSTFLFGILFTIIFVFIPSKIYSWFNELPNPELLVIKSAPQPTRILDRNGRLLYEIYIDKKYDPVKLEQIPQHVLDATIAVEDDQFYNHNGFDVQGMIRAAKLTLLDDKLQGGSTVTQQLVKNVLLTPERTLSRKVKELVLAVLVEAKYSKEQILEMYLNNISYGGSAWGVQSASQKFFGKNVYELDLAEASLLAGLPTAPSIYSPLHGDIEQVKARQRYVLDRMWELGMVPKEDAEAAFNEELIFVPQTEYIRAPHFVSYVRKDLENKYGKRFVELGGLTITTTLDLELHEKVQQIVTEEVEKYGWLLISNGAAVVLDSRNAEILAYVGSVDYFKEEWGAFDVITSLRQPGSSIKPVTYALALESGFTASSVIEDKAITYKIPGQPPYTPKNYDDKFHGKVTFREALANSYNIPAVKVADAVGPDNIVSIGKEFGLSNWEVDGSYGLSVTLGGKEVKLLEHTNLFATFAREGKFRETTPYLSILDGRGYDVYSDHREERIVISQETAYIIWHILSDYNARIPAFGTSNFLNIPGKRVAVKTGTTDNIRDNFTMGFTPSYTVGVWVGNNDNTPLHRSLASGLSGAAPIWNKIMTIVLEDKSNEVMPLPDSIFSATDEKCGRSEIFVKGTKVPDDLCAADKEDDDDKDKDKDKKDKKKDRD